MKKTYIKVSNQLLADLLQLPENVQIDLVYTPDEQYIYKPDTFEVILSGEGLDDKFTVCDGCKLLQGSVNVTTKTTVSIDKVEIT